MKSKQRELSIPSEESLNEILRFAELGKNSSGILHDLANQMTSLSLSIGLAEECSRRDAKRLLEFAQKQKTARRNIEYIACIIKDHMCTVSKNYFSVKKEITKVVSCLKQKLNDNKIILNTDVSIENKIFGNSVKFGRVLLNLLNNSIESCESSKQKKIFITANQENGNTRIKITDTGRGMSAEMIKKLFNSPFTTKTQGHGIGLQEVQKIIRNDFKGKIFVTSQTGKGTEFELIFPNPNKKRCLSPLSAFKNEISLLGSKSLGDKRSA